MQRQLTTTWRRGALSAALVLGLTGPVYAVSGVIGMNRGRTSPSWLERG